MEEKERRVAAGLLIFAASLLFSVSQGFCASVASETRTGVGASLVVPPRGCTIMTTKLIFNSTAFGRGAKSDGNISVRCDSGVPYGITLDGGMNATPVSRRMRSDNNYFLNYSLFQDRNRTIHWGSGSIFGPTKSFTGNGRRQVHRIYGSADFSATTGAGNYSDQISLTIYY